MPLSPLASPVNAEDALVFERFVASQERAFRPFRQTNFMMAAPRVNFRLDNIGNNISGHGSQNGIKAGPQPVVEVVVPQLRRSVGTDEADREQDKMAQDKAAKEKADQEKEAKEMEDQEKEAREKVCRWKMPSVKNFLCILIMAGLLVAVFRSRSHASSPTTVSTEELQPDLKHLLPAPWRDLNIDLHLVSIPSYLTTLIHNDLTGQILHDAELSTSPNRDALLDLTRMRASAYVSMQADCSIVDIDLAQVVHTWPALAQSQLALLTASPNNTTLTLATFNTHVTNQMTDLSTALSVCHKSTSIFLATGPHMESHLSADFDTAASTKNTLHTSVIFGLRSDSVRAKRLDPFRAQMTEARSLDERRREWDVSAERVRDKVGGMLDVVLDAARMVAKLDGMEGKDLEVAGRLFGAMHSVVEFLEMGDEHKGVEGVRRRRLDRLGELVWTGAGLC